MEHARIHACDTLKMLPGTWTTRAGEILSVILAFLLGHVVDPEHAIFLLLNKFLHDPLGSSLLLSLAMPRLLTMEAVDVVYDGCHSSDSLDPMGKLWVSLHLLHSLTSKNQPFVAFALPYGTSWLHPSHAPVEAFAALVKRTHYALRGCPDQVGVFPKLVALGKLLPRDGAGYERIAQICEKGV